MKTGHFVYEYPTRTMHNVFRGFLSWLGETKRQKLIFNQGLGACDSISVQVP